MIIKGYADLDWEMRLQDPNLRLQEEYIKIDIIKSIFMSYLRQISASFNGK